PWVYRYAADDGMLRTLLPEGGIQTVRASDDPEARGILERERTSVVDLFRKRFAEAALRDVGRTTFAGRPAEAYETGEGSRRETYYIDPETAIPLGSVIAWRGFRYTEVVRRFERLPATAENLARLSAPWVTRAERPARPGG
ncbi:MAG TPA: hypothetical protein VKB09_17395, partial [Thermomicrobiales bacterium]|nr:hypothetical protein [Thermomicrobiales bacterium]